MELKKVVPSPAPERTLQKELRFLYWRRSAVDALIRSLEQYSLTRLKPTEIPKRKIA